MSSNRDILEDINASSPAVFYMTDALYNATDGKSLVKYKIS